MSSTPPAADATTRDDGFDATNYWERRLRSTPGLKGVGYARLGQQFNEAMYELRRRTFPVFLQEWGITRTPFDVLDIGSGTGFYIQEWTKAGARSVTGSDLTRVAVERLSQAFPGVAFHQFDVGGAERPAAFGQYDIVSAMDMLFHIVDDAAYERAIRNCHALTKPGGHFVLSEVFLEGERVSVPHMVSRSLREISALLEDTGFEIVDRRPMFVLMNYPVDAGRLAQLAWTAMMAPSVVSDVYGGLIGKLLMPIERKLVLSRREGPSTEIMLCRRR